MEIYNFKKDGPSILGLDTRIIASISYIALIVFRFIRTVVFIFGSGYLKDYGFYDRLAAFLSIYVNKYELLICIIPVIILILEKRSKKVRYFNFQYLIIHLFIPMIYILLALAIFMILGITGADYVGSIIYLYGAMMIYGMYAIIMTIVSLYIVYCAFHDRTSNLSFISRISERLTKI